MAAFACPDCGSQVSGKAEVCPGCGRPLDSVEAPGLAPVVPDRTLELEGRWEGRLKDVWSVRMVLRVGGRRVDGEATWSLLSCPPRPRLAWAWMKGRYATELVEGTADGATLSLRGHGKDPPNHEGICLSEYDVRLDFEAGTFEGSTEPLGEDDPDDPGAMKGKIVRC